ncbi:BCCT family transporter [Bowmanella denitrificans]|uniref:BCCT family transporter n=1 Tax=Bowmanella denitrificans TaxID=366582 RepID=A0ABP3HM86_9ALTE
MYLLLVGLGLTAVLALVMLWFYADKPCIGTHPVGLWSFVAILFTTSLDIGLVMLPLTEFPRYADTGKFPQYSLTNPLAMEFAMWGCLNWALYFVSSLYFCLLEPRLGFFRLVWVNRLNSLVIIGTCAFTLHLFMVNLPWYLPALQDKPYAHVAANLLLAVVLLCAIVSSLHLRWLTWLSRASLWALLGAIVLLYWDAGVQWQQYMGYLGELADYFRVMPLLLMPLDDQHEFYLLWWFSWSIMIGQFMARFLNGIKPWRLLLVLLLLPSIPIALWFSLLYHFQVQNLSLSTLAVAVMLALGILFLINSLDSLIRLYAENLNLDASRLGTSRYILLHFILLMVLGMLYNAQWLKIQLFGALVILLYILGLAYWARHRNQATSLSLQHRRKTR